MTTVPVTTLSSLWHHCRQAWPYLWPVSDFWIQLRVLLCLVIVLAARGVTVLIPIYQKKIVDSMILPTQTHADDRAADDSLVANCPVDTGFTATECTAATQPAHAPGAIHHPIPQFHWEFIVICILLKAFKAGYCNILRSMLWIKVSQNTKRRMRLKLFAHLHSLSLQWHLQRKTGEVLKVMDRGVNSINIVLSHILFNVLPVFADVSLGVMFLILSFSVWIGLMIFAAMGGYLVCTFYLTEWRTMYRRKKNAAENERSTASVDSILNFENVKYYAAEDMELDRYSCYVDEHLAAEWSFNMMSNLVQGIQRTIVTVGLLGGATLCAWYVHQGRFTVGDYVLFLSYVEQLYVPLQGFGNNYRRVGLGFPGWMRI